ncbi:hypothetical protein IEQ44_04980 [Nocardioides sp. Y6]|uniref:Uncharacterized protein n=1 Tax=Nocardioides malaquae TaxID=2773426 RepID=A0ABR9RS50_9ACTN|nr:hypothetical protein [Nocardioides malaquae]MBE7324002.1 hypothetical protein [Nocardioides malaquae]
MTRGDELPRHLGDHPHGAYWSADAPPGDHDVKDVPHVPEGPIRFMWDYGVRVPLWDDSGLLPEDPAWLRDALGLDDALILDLARWGHDMDELDQAAPEHRTDAAYAALDTRARALMARLERMLDGRFVVTYQPWT